MDRIEEQANIWGARQYIAKREEDRRDMSLLGSLPTKTTRGSRNQDEEDERGSRRAKRRRYKLLEDN